MQANKRIIGLMAFAYLLGILTAGLALEAVGLVRGQQVPALVLVVAGVALLLSAAGLGWALWVLTASSSTAPARPGSVSRGAAGAGAAVPPRAAARRRPEVDLPTVTDYYENASDGVLPAPAPAHRDLDPASDPLLSA